MAKYLAHIAGRIREVVAAAVSTGAADADKLVATDGTGKIDQSFLPTGIGADTKVVVASEALAAGDFVNYWSNAGVTNVRKADASTSGKEADGFVLAAVASGANATIYHEGTNTQRTGLTPAARYYLSDTAPGGITTAVPAGAGKVVQYIGKAISATELSFEPEDGVILA